MTEDEAKTKMCPLLPIALGPTGVPMMFSTGGVYADNAAPARQFGCVGSNCMMWTGFGCSLNRSPPTADK